MGSRMTRLKQPRTPATENNLTIRAMTWELTSNFCIGLYNAAPITQLIPPVAAQSRDSPPWAGLQAARGYDNNDELSDYLFAVRPSFCFCPGTGRRGACGSPSAEPPPRLREAWGGITPGRFGPFMPLEAAAGAAATGVAGISGAIGTADAAKGSSKEEARAMAPEPQPRSHRPCRPGAETGEQSVRAPSRSPDFRGETRVAVRRPAASDGAMGRGGGLSKEKTRDQHAVYR